jgi:hypothetical protein
VGVGFDAGLLEPAVVLSVSVEHGAAETGEAGDDGNEDAGGDGGQRCR